MRRMNPPSDTCVRIVSCADSSVGERARRRCIVPEANSWTAESRSVAILAKEVFVPIRLLTALFASGVGAVVLLAVSSCAESPRLVEVTREVHIELTRELPITVEVEREIEVTIEVPVTVEVEREVLSTVNVPVTVEIEKEVEVTRDVPVTVEVEVTRRIEVAVTREVYVTREVEVTREIEVTREVPVTVIVEKLAATPSPTASGLSDETLDELTTMMLKLINDQREEEGLSPLRLSGDSAGQIAAQKHAEDMMTRCYLRHRTGRTSHWDRYILAGGDENRYRLIAENIAVQGIELGNVMTHDPRTGETWRSIRCLDPDGDYLNVSIHGHLTRVHRGLMDSPAHRDNILDPEFEEVALGFAWKYPALWVVQLFFLE